MNCGVVEEEEDDIGSFTSSSSSSSSPSGLQRPRVHSSHSPTTSTTNSSLSIDLNHHSPLTSSSSPHIREFDHHPSGLNLLVAALDAQHPLPDHSRDQRLEYQTYNRFDHHQSLIDARGTLTHSSVSDEEVTVGKRSSRRKSSIPDTCKDEAYWEKRKRNNEAAKKSREKRRVNDMAMEARLMELSRENNLLKHELDSVKKHHHPTTPPTPSYLLMQANSDVTFSNDGPEAAGPHLAPLSPSPAPALGPSLPLQRPAFLHSNSSVAAAAAVGFVNPLLAAVVPPHMILQAIAQQQHHHQSLSSPVPFRPIGKQRPPPFSVNDVSPASMITGVHHRQQSPTAPMLAAALSAPASPGPPASSFSDGKQYLRYKLLERQLQQQKQQGASSTVSSAAGSVISNSGIGLKPPQSAPIPSNCTGPPMKRQKLSATVAGPRKMSNWDSNMEKPLSLKECLSSLEVSLISPASGEKVINGCEQTTNKEQQNGTDHVTTGVASSTSVPEDTCTGDLLRSRTHSDSSQSSAGIISNHSSSSSMGTVSIDQNGALKLEMECRAAFAPDGRRDSTNSDSGIVSDEGRWNGKRYRSDHERYMERRRRNNEAAKRCRANRRAMFEYRYQRAQELENENARLKDEMRALNHELAELKQLLDNRDGIIKMPAGEEHLKAQSVLKTETAGILNAQPAGDSRTEIVDETRKLSNHVGSNRTLASDADIIVEKHQLQGSVQESITDTISQDSPLDFTVKKENL